MKMEATALFAAIKAQAKSSRWWYFAEMQRLGRAVVFEQSISSYRASLHWDYLFDDIDMQIYLEREAHIGKIGENRWTLSCSGIEGKIKALKLQEHLKLLQQEGFYIPNGNENLERQMNFSLGLYGACLMHVDIVFPVHQPPLPCVFKVLDLLDQENKKSTPSLEEALNELSARQAAAQATDSDDDQDIMMGDWQTWK